MTGRTSQPDGMRETGSSSQPDSMQGAADGASGQDSGVRDVAREDQRLRQVADADPWTAWRQFTNARIALGRTGHALPTAPWLAFNLAHAQARDAVHHPLDVAAIQQEVAELGRSASSVGSTESVDSSDSVGSVGSADATGTAGSVVLTGSQLEVVAVQSAADDRAVYLRRPDLGRKLSEESRQRLTALKTTPKPELLFVIADGLSATAAARQAVPLLQQLLPLLEGWRIGPIVIATQARVALGDDIGELLGADFVVMLIGERPGLSSPDSLGLYLTHGPKVGRRDAERNCISNVRPEGLGFDAAAGKLHYLLTQARRLGLTGIGLKDESERLALKE